MRFPKRLFYKDCSEYTLRHHVGYHKPGGGYNMLFSMNYVNEFHKAVAERIVHLWNTAQPQENEEGQKTPTNSKSMPLSCDECSAEMYDHHSYCWSCGTHYPK